jgi:2-keto-3-deoxy-L-fuconate dehydrogenase
LAGKTALITAAGQGVGLATADAFTREGARVVATDIRIEGLANRPFEVRRLDVRDGMAIKALAAEVGTIDVLFNCAGFVHAGSILEASEEDWDVAFDLNVKSMFRMIRAFLPGMLEKGGGSIINISSVASSLKGAPNRCVYGASKAAVIGLTKAVAADFITRGVRRASANGSHRNGGGNCGFGVIFGLRRVIVHDWTCPCDRRRLVQLSVLSR